MAAPVKLEHLSLYLDRAGDLVLRGLSIGAFELLCGAADWDYIFDLEELSDAELKRVNYIVLQREMEKEAIRNG